MLNCVCVKPSQDFCEKESVRRNVLEEEDADEGRISPTSSNCQKLARIFKLQVGYGAKSSPTPKTRRLGRKAAKKMLPAQRRVETLSILLIVSAGVAAISVLQQQAAGQVSLGRQSE